MSLVTWRPSHPVTQQRYISENPPSKCRIVKRCIRDVRGAARALGRIKNDAVVQPLIDGLRDGNARVRTRVAAALGEMRAASAIPALSAAVSDSITAVRRAVVGALAAMRDDRATEALISALQDSDADIRRRAARALGRRGG